VTSSVGPKFLPKYLNRDQEFYDLLNAKITVITGDVVDSIKKFVNPEIKDIGIAVLDNLKSLYVQTFRDFDHVTLQRLILNQRDSLNLNFKFEIPGSQARENIPLPKSINYFVFLGLGAVCSSVARGIWGIPPSDVDSRLSGNEEVEWNKYDQITLESLRFLAKTRGIPYCDSESIEELRLKLNVLVVYFWGDFIEIIFEDHDFGIGRYKRFCLVMDSALHLVAIPESISEDLETLSAKLESSSGNMVSVYIFQKNRFIVPLNEADATYAAYFGIILKIMKGAVCNFKGAMKTYRDKFLNYIITSKLGPDKVATLAKNIVGNHYKNELAVFAEPAKAVLLFTFEISLTNGELSSEFFDNVWKELFPSIDNNNFYSNPLGVLGAFFTIRRDLIGAVFFLRAILALGMPQRGSSAGHLTRHDDEPYIECSVQGQNFLLPYSLERWSEVIETHYLKEPSMHNSKMAEYLIMLFCEHYKRQEQEDYPVIYMEKEHLKCNEKLILERIKKFMAVEDHLLQLFGTALAAGLAAKNNRKSQESQAFLIYVCIPKIKSWDSHFQYRDQVLALVNMLCPFLDPEDEYPEQAEPLDEVKPILPDASLTRQIQEAVKLLQANITLTESSVTSVNSLLEKMNNTALEHPQTCYPFLRQAVLHPALHHEVFLEVVVKYGSVALDQPGILPTTIAALCLNPTIKNKLISFSKAHYFLLRLAESLAYERTPASIGFAVEIMQKIHVNYSDTLTFAYFCRLIQFLNTYDTAALEYLTITTEIRKIAKQERNLPPHLLLNGIFHSKAVLKSTEIETLKNICPQLLKLKHDSWKEAAEWLTNPNSVSIVGLVCWTECVMLWFAVAVKNSYFGLWSIQRKCLEIALDSDQLTPQSQLLSYYFNKNLFIYLYPDATKRWLVLNKVSLFLNIQTKPIWQRLTLSLGSYFTQQQQFPLSYEIISHPLIKSEELPSIYESNIPCLMAYFAKEATVESATSLFELMNNYQKYASESRWKILWNLVSSLKNKDLIERVFKRWLSFYLVPSLSTTALALVALSRVNSSLFKKFIGCSSLILNVFKSEEIPLSDRLKIVEKYLLLLIGQTNPNKRIFKEIFTLLSQLKSSIESQVPFYLFILSNFNPENERELYQTALKNFSQYLDDIGESKSFPHKFIIQQFVSKWKMWPKPLNQEIGFLNQDVLAGLCTIYSNDRNFLQNCVLYFLNLPVSYEYDREKGDCVLLFMNTVYQVYRSKSQSNQFCNSTLSTRIVQRFLDWGQLPCFSHYIVQITCLENIQDTLDDPQLLEKAWVATIQAILDRFNTDLSSCNSVLGSFQKAYPHLNHLGEEKVGIVEKAIKVVLTLASKYKNTKLLQNITEYNFVTLFTNDADRCNYIQFYVSQLINFQPDDYGIHCIIFEELTHYIKKLLINQEFLKLSVHRQPLFKNAVINYFFYIMTLDSVTFSIDNPPELKTMFFEVEKSEILKDDLLTLQEIELFVFSTERCKYAPEKEAQELIFYRLINRFSISHPHLLYQLPIIFLECSAIKTRYPFGDVDQLDFADKLLAAFEKQNKLITNYEYLLLGQLFYTNMTTIDYVKGPKRSVNTTLVLKVDPKATTSRIFGKFYWGTSEQLRVVQLHKRFFQLLTVVKLRSIDQKYKFPSSLSDHLIALINAGLFNSIDLNAKKLLWNVYCEIILNLLTISIFFHSVIKKNLTNTEKLVHNLILSYTQYATGKFAPEKINLSVFISMSSFKERCILYANILKKIQKYIESNELIIEDLKSAFASLPLWRYCATSDLFEELVPKAYIQSFTSEEEAYNSALSSYYEIKGKENSFEKKNLSVLIVALNRVQAVIQNSDTLPKKLLYQHYTQVVFEFCKYIYDLKLYKKAILIAINLFQNIDVIPWTSLDQSQFYLTLIKTGYELDIKYTPKLFELACSKLLFEVQPLNEEAFLIIKYALTQIYKTSQCGISISSPTFEAIFDSIENYCRWKFSKNNFLDLLWIYYLLRLSPKHLSTCWLLGADEAFKANQFLACISLIYEYAIMDAIIHKPQEIIQKHYIYSTEALRKLPQSSYDTNERSKIIHCMLYKECAALYLNKAESETDIAILGNFVWRCLILYNSFDTSKLSIAKLKPWLIQKIKKAKKENASLICKYVKIFLHPHQGIEEKRHVFEINFHLVSYLIDAQAPHEISACFKVMNNHFKFHATEESIAWLTLAVDIQNRLFDQKYYLQVVELHALLQKIPQIVPLPEKLNSMFSAFLAELKENYSLEFLTKTIAMIPLGLPENLLLSYEKMIKLSMTCDAPSTLLIGKACILSESTKIKLIAYDCLLEALKKSDKLEKDILENLLSKLINLPEIVFSKIFKSMKLIEKYQMIKPDVLNNYWYQIFDDLCKNKFENLDPNSGLTVIQDHISAIFENVETTKLFADCFARALAKAFFKTFSIPNLLDCLFKVLNCIPKSAHKTQPAAKIPDPKEIQSYELAQKALQNYPQVGIIFLLIHYISKNISDKGQVSEALCVISLTEALIKNYPSTYSANAILCAIFTPQPSEIADLFVIVIAIERTFTQYLHKIFPKCPEHAFLYNCYLNMFSDEKLLKVLKDEKKLSSQVKMNLREFLVKLYDESGHSYLVNARNRLENAKI